MITRESIELLASIRAQTGTASIEAEFLAETASTLGGAERAVKSALAALARSGSGDERRLAAAQRAVWAYFVQRELIGFRDHSEVIRDLGIPSEVLAGLGTAQSLRQR